MFSSAHGAHISSSQDDSPLVASYNFNVMPPYGDNHQLHDDTTIDELKASLAAVNRSLQAAPNADTMTDIQTAMAELNSRLTSLGQSADELQSRVHVNDTSDNADVMLTYERWGRTECPDDTGATLVYAGT